MKIPFADDDLRLAIGNSLFRVAPFAGRFHGGFDGLGSGIHRERHVHAGEVVQFFVEQRQLGVAKRARCQRNFARLLHQGFNEFRVAVALIYRGIGGQAIEVALPFHVKYPRAFAALDYDVERVIIVRAVSLFERDELFRSRQIEMRGRHAETPIAQTSQVFKRQAGCNWRLFNPVKTMKTLWHRVAHCAIHSPTRGGCRDDSRE